MQVHEFCQENMFYAYKIASACIANRLSTMLPNLIYRDQKGFMKRRCTGETIRLLVDVLMFAEAEKYQAFCLWWMFRKRWIVFYGQL